MSTINCREFRCKKEKVFPVISPAPKDHHSLLQLYLDGPKDKFFYVFSSNVKWNNKSLNNIKLSTIKEAQKMLF